MNASTSASGLILAAFSRLDSSMSISVGSNNSRKIRKKTLLENRLKVHPKCSIGTGSSSYRYFWGMEPIDES
jgi:hypothetical protein